MQNVKFHRLVVDESHLLEQSGAGTMCGQADSLIKYQTSNVWLVTGTPFSTSLNQLKYQACVLGHSLDGLQLKRGKLRDATVASAHGARPSPPPPKLSPLTSPPFATRKDVWKNSYSGPPQLDNDEVVDRLKKIMIRHTKSQRIGGQVALSLPETDQTTVWLDMSDDEALAPHSSPLPPTPRPLGLTD